MRTEAIISSMERYENSRRKKRMLWKIKRGFLRGMVFLIGSLTVDFAVLGLALVEPERMLLILSVGLCLAVNAWLSHIIFERKESQHEQTDRTAGQENSKSIDTAGDRCFRICAGQR